MDKNHEMVCSFCLKEQGEVNRLIDGGDSVYICDGCVELCSDLLNSTKEVATHTKSRKKKTYVS